MARSVKKSPTPGRGMRRMETGMEADGRETLRHSRDGCSMKTKIDGWSGNLSG